ncbi:MAG TPA: PHP domain-containing protein [Bryobacteraceae bacterium]|nr:PHP domain-containing protein [Bryobacteraceae bacterium]
MIDLHTHTTESDGTYSPSELVAAARQLGLEAIAVTDHDTFAGYDKADPIAREQGVRLIRGIELSTALGNPKTRTVHLLGYFLAGEPAPEFHAWLERMQAARHDRNVRLAAKLQSMGLDVTIEEVKALGRSLAGRPHFAKLLITKGYVTSIQEAFSRYLSDTAPGFVEREEPALEDAIRRVNDAGGISSLAHPVRLGKRDHAEEEQLIAGMCDAGLQAIEVFHSDHNEADRARYLALSAKYGMKVTGGSDFHGDNKPNIQLGSGQNNNLNISKSILESLLQDR